jgi:hypothetical protein
MGGPSLSLCVLESRQVQPLACIGLACAQNKLRLAIGGHDQMNVIASNVQRMQRPAAKAAFFHDCVTYEITASGIEMIGLLRHLLAYGGPPFRTRHGERRSHRIVIFVHGAGTLAMQPRSISRERDEVSHRLVGHNNDSII